MTEEKCKNVISWLQISDLHFFESSAMSIWYEYLERYFKEKIDFLIVTGDLHQYEKRPGSGIGNYKKSIDELNKLMEHIGLDGKKNVFMVPGNHDTVDFRGKNKLLEKIDKEAKNDWDCYNEYKKKLETAMDVYQKFVRTFYGAEDIYNGQSIHNHTQVWNDRIEILHLNTALVCNEDNQRKELVNLIELSEIKRKRPELPMIAIAHHSFYRIHEIQKPLLKAFLTRLKISAYFCGDEHRESKETIDLEGRSVPLIVCGKSAIDSSDYWSNVDVIHYQWHYTEPGSTVEIRLYKWDPQIPGLVPSYSLVTEEQLQKGVKEGKIRYPEFSMNPNSKQKFSWYPAKKARTASIRVNLKKMRRNTAEQVQNSLLFPWLKRESASFSLIYDDLYIKPKLWYQNKNEYLSLEKLLNISEENRNQKLWILGDAGMGKSSLLKYIFLKRCEKENILFLNALDLFKKKKSEKVVYIESLLNKSRRPGQNLWLLIDGIDEAFASDIKGVRDFLEQVGKLSCKVWLGCRAQYFDQFVEENDFHRITIQKWEVGMADRYVHKYFYKISRPDLISKYRLYYEQHECIRGFAENPFHLVMLLYLLENDPDGKLELKNIYALYQEFFRQWMRKESHRKTGLKKEMEEIYEQLWEIARKLYDRQQAIETTSDTAILGLVTTEPIDDGRKIVTAFYHRSFMEFLLAKGVLAAMQKDVKKLIVRLQKNNRSDVDTFIKAGFDVMPYDQKNKMADNMIKAYWEVKNNKTLLEGDEDFYVRNQIVYYITRMKGMNKEPVEKFIKDIYRKESLTVMQQGIAYGAANLGIFDIALEFAKRMEPGSREDITNRSWTLVFYGDMPEEDPLHYVDDGIASWSRSRSARLRRLKGKKQKDQAFRMFDLRIMYGFLESRNWTELSREELEIIKDCETHIPGYPKEVVEFLERAKMELVEEYEKRGALSWE